jgi:hypothetical protein
MFLISSRASIQLRSFTFILLNNSEIIPAVLNVLYNTGIHVGPKIKHSSHQVSYNRKPNGQLRIRLASCMTNVVSVSDRPASCMTNVVSVSELLILN